MLNAAPIKEALHLLEIASYDEVELMAYDREWDAVRSEKTLLSGRFKEGKAEIIRRLHRSGLSLEQISQAAELSQDEFQRIISSAE